jgi:hypothetical protein
MKRYNSNENFNSINKYKLKQIRYFQCLLKEEEVNVNNPWTWNKNDWITHINVIDQI